jgi:hypothetical protein
VADQTTAPCVRLPDPHAVVLVDDEPNKILLFHHGMRVAKAWSETEDGTGQWWYEAPGTQPRRIDSRAWAETILGDLWTTYDRRERSVYLPEHGPLDEHGYLRNAPQGVCCVGCGQDLSGDPFVATMEYATGPLTTHFICDPCNCYLDDEGDDD